MLSINGIVFLVQVTLVKYEAKHNARVRYNEHNNSTKSLEPSKWPQSNINHCFILTAISNASKHAATRKNLEASYIAILFRNGVT